MNNVSRRAFLCRLASLLGAGWFLSACGPQQGITVSISQAAPDTPPPSPSPTTNPPSATATSKPPPSPTTAATAAPTYATPPVTDTPLPPSYTPVPATPTPLPQATPTPTPAPELDRAALSAHWPQTETSPVLLVRNSQAMAGGSPEIDTVNQMLDAAMMGLTGVSDPLAGWRTLFSPEERVLLKVNCIAAGGPTQPVVAYAAAQRLQDAGLAPEDILIFDRSDGELSAAGYQLNDGGAGVQCRGPRGEGSEAKLSQATVRFYQEFDEYDAVVNIPTPKGHGISGVSCAMKNHYGSINNPGALHGGNCNPHLPDLNAQPQIRDKTRLIVGAALNVSPFDWNSPEPDNAILLSTDPVALDTVARDILVQHHQAKGQDGGGLVHPSHYLQTAQEVGLGTSDPTRIDLRLVDLG